MKAASKALLLCVLAMLLISCNILAPKPTETPLPTETSLPTSTFTPETTITPKSTEITTADVLPTPSEKPLSEWEGIPIMPNAIAGDGDSNSYYFTVKSSPDDVQNFYEPAMAQLGWDLFASGQGTTEALMLFFMKDTATAGISAFPQPDDVVYVLIVK